MNTGRQQQSAPLGEEAVTGGARNERVELRHLDAVLGIAAWAVKGIVEVVRCISLNLATMTRGLRRACRA